MRFLTFAFLSIAFIAQSSVAADAPEVKLDLVKINKIALTKAIEVFNEKPEYTKHLLFLAFGFNTDATDIAANKYKAYGNTGLKSTPWGSKGATLSTVLNLEYKKQKDADSYLDGSLRADIETGTVEFIRYIEVQGYGISALCTPESIKQAGKLKDKVEKLCSEAAKLKTVQNFPELLTALDKTSLALGEVYVADEEMGNFIPEIREIFAELNAQIVKAKETGVVNFKRRLAFSEAILGINAINLEFTLSEKSAGVSAGVEFPMTEAEFESTKKSTFKYLADFQGETEASVREFKDWVRWILDGVVEIINS